MIIEPEMIVIPAGEFLMGCEAGANNERPVHRLFVDEFAIGCFTITNRLYRFFIEDTAHQAASGWNDLRFNHPDQFLQSVSQLTTNLITGTFATRWRAITAGQAG